MIRERKVQASMLRLGMKLEAVGTGEGKEREEESGRRDIEACCIYSSNC